MTQPWQIKAKQAIRAFIPYGLIEAQRRMRGLPLEVSVSQPTVAAPAVPASEELLSPAYVPPLPDVPLLLPVRPLSALFPGIDTQELTFIASQIPRQHHWSLPLEERLVLGAICRYANFKDIVEIGTYTGASTLVIGMNSADDARIYTLDLDPEGRKALGAPDYKSGEHFLPHTCSSKIAQWYGDSQTFDFSPHAGNIDFVYIDANHTFPFVTRDSNVAFDLIREDGVILWDDYVWQAEHPECSGVAEYVNALKDGGCCFHIEGTRFAIWSKRFSQEPFQTLLQAVSPNTMVGIERLTNVYDMAYHAEANGLQGAYVECGVWKGGCAAILAYVAQQAGHGRKTWLFDSFEGLPEPTQEDGLEAAQYAGGRDGGRLTTIDQCVASMDFVETLLFETLKLDPRHVVIVKGWFQDTLVESSERIGPIAVLRLDGDWYDSTRLCFDALYDQVVPGGVVIIDDYGHWEGCRRATDEFLARRNIDVSLVKIDYTGYYFFKP